MKPVGEILVSTGGGVAFDSDLQGTGRASLPAYLFAAGLGALLQVRRRYPRAVLVLTLLGIFGHHALGFPPIGIPLPAVGAIYSASEQDRTRDAAAAGAVLVRVTARSW